MKEQILALRAKVGRSSEAVGRVQIAASALTTSLPTIAIHPAVTILPLKPAMSAFSTEIPLMTGASTAPVWGAIPLVPQPAYPLAYPYPLPPTRIPVPELRCFKAQTMLE